jgi:hypothetical protein
VPTSTEHIMMLFVEKKLNREYVRDFLVIVISSGPEKYIDLLFFFFFLLVDLGGKLRNRK